MIIGNKTFDTENETYIFGILNVTPDSFSDGGKFNNIDAALYHTEQMIKDGADIIDIGGESTRPGYEKISVEEEIKRTAPIIEAVCKHFDVPISIDTYKADVAAAAIDAGACLINDIWGFKADPLMAPLAAKTGVACCLMHNKDEAVYNDFLKDSVNELLECVDIAKKAGVKEENIILDPGVGFGKSYENNLDVIANLKIYKNMGYPVLLGTSRKSVVGLTLELPTDQRVEGTLVTTVYGVRAGCAFVRVHDVKENARAVKMTRAIMRMEK